MGVAAHVAPPSRRQRKLKLPARCRRYAARALGARPAGARNRRAETSNIVRRYKSAKSQPGTQKSTIWFTSFAGSPPRAILECGSKGSTASLLPLCIAEASFGSFKAAARVSSAYQTAALHGGGDTAATAKTSSLTRATDPLWVTSGHRGSELPINSGKPCL